MLSDSLPSYVPYISVSLRSALRPHQHTHIHTPPTFHQTIHPLFTADVTEVWSYETSVERKNAAGGTAKSSVLAQVAAVQGYLQGLK